MHDISLDSGVIDNPQEAALGHLNQTHESLTERYEAVKTRLFRRPAWLSPEIMAVVVGGVDFSLVLAAAAAAFGTYGQIMDQTVAEPGRHILTSFLAATIFVGLLERF